MRVNNDEVFEKIIKDYYKILFSISYNYTHNISDSEDVVQDAFNKLYRTHKEFEEYEHIKNWLIRVTINSSIDAIKKRNKIQIVDQEYFNNLSYSSLEEKESDEEIWFCISLLRDSYKSVIILFYFEGYSIKEIACILNISTSNVTTRLNRAKQKLKEIIDKRRRNNDGYRA